MNMMKKFLSAALAASMDLGGYRGRLVHPGL